VFGANGRGGRSGGGDYNAVFAVGKKRTGRPARSVVRRTWGQAQPTASACKHPGGLGEAQRLRPRSIESLFLVFSSIEGRREEGKGRNWVVEMQSYTLPPVGTTRYY
jgi:hypothetical protein